MASQHQLDAMNVPQSYDIAIAGKQSEREAVLTMEKQAQEDEAQTIFLKEQISKYMGQFQNLQFDDNDINAVRTVEQGERQKIAKAIRDAGGSPTSFLIGKDGFSMLREYSSAVLNSEPYRKASRSAKAYAQYWADVVQKPDHIANDVVVTNDKGEQLNVSMAEAIGMKQKGLISELPYTGFVRDISMEKIQQHFAALPNPAGIDRAQVHPRVLEMTLRNEHLPESRIKQVMNDYMKVFVADRIDNPLNPIMWGTRPNEQNNAAASARAAASATQPLLKQFPLTASLTLPYQGGVNQKMAANQRSVEHLSNHAAAASNMPYNGVGASDATQLFGVSANNQGAMGMLTGAFVSVGEMQPGALSKISGVTANKEPDGIHFFKHPETGKMTPIFLTSNHVDNNSSWGSTLHGALISEASANYQKYFHQSQRGLVPTVSTATDSYLAIQGYSGSQSDYGDIIMQNLSIAVAPEILTEPGKEFFGMKDGQLTGQANTPLAFYRPLSAVAAATAATLENSYSGTNHVSGKDVPNPY